MGLMNKIKGIFMEEVIVEEDDEEEIKREREREKESKKEKEKENKKEKVQVAKKIENSNPVHEEEKVVEDIISIEEEELNQESDDDKTKEFSRPIESVVENEYKFPMNFDDKDFEMDERKEVEEVKEEPIIEEPKEEPVLYHERRVDREPAYDFSVAEVRKEPYDNSENKKGFQRSPIISPVYGILDKNYRKEEIVSKREIRLTTNNQKADLDLVREKAYGDLANDITESIHEEIIDSSEDDNEEVVEGKDNLLYDLSEDASPSVKEVTVGDAEEYFNDLGLEYNVDYKVEKEEPSIKNEDIEEKEEEPIPEPKKEKEKDEEDDDLFDLIDAMYDSK